MNEHILCFHEFNIGIYEPSHDKTCFLQIYIKTKAQISCAV